MQRTDSFEKTLMLGKTEGRRRGRHPDSSVGKESASNAENPGLISGLGRSAGEWNSYPLQSVFLPGESPGQRKLAVYSPWSHKESDRTERLTLN